MRPILEIVLLVLDLYGYIIIATAVMSWLLAFNIINARNEVVRAIWNTLLALTEPVLMRVRRFLPNTGGIDISPVVVYIVILLIEKEIYYLMAPSGF
jgi:YggT family protein